MGKTTATKTATTAPVAAAAPTNVVVETAPATPARRGKKDKMYAQEAAPTTPVPETVSVAAVPETEDDMDDDEEIDDETEEEPNS